MAPRGLVLVAPLAQVTRRSNVNHCGPPLLPSASRDGLPAAESGSAPPWSGGSNSDIAGLLMRKPITARKREVMLRAEGMRGGDAPYTVPPSLRTEYSPSSLPGPCSGEARRAQPSSSCCSRH